MMHIDNEKRVDLYSGHFTGMRNDLNAYIGSALHSMEKKKMDCASIGLKIDIVLAHKTIIDDNAPTGQREAILPDISYKLALTMQAKADTRGEVTRYDHELVKGEDGSYYIVSAEEASGQLNMFNGYDELPDEDDDSGYDEEHA